MYSHFYYDLNGNGGECSCSKRFTPDGKILREIIFSLSSNNNEEDMNKMIL